MIQPSLSLWRTNAHSRFSVRVVRPPIFGTKLARPAQIACARATDTSIRQSVNSNRWDSSWLKARASDRVLTDGHTAATASASSELYACR